MDNEEVEPGNLSEMEAELSDEEYEDETDSSVEEEKEDKGEREVKETGADQAPSNGSNSDKDTLESSSSDDDGQSDSGQSDSDNDDILPVSRQLSFSLRKSRVIDSDDESSGDVSDTESGSQRNKPGQDQPCFPPKKEGSVPAKFDQNIATAATQQQLATFSDDATMGPLIFDGLLANGDEVADSQLPGQTEQTSKEEAISQGVCCLSVTHLTLMLHVFTVHDCLVCVC